MPTTSCSTVFRVAPDRIVVLALSALAVGCGGAGTGSAHDGGTAGDAPSDVALDAGPSADGAAPDGPTDAAAPDSAADTAATDTAADGPELPAACRVTTNRGGLFQVTFHLRNSGARTVYLHTGCTGVSYDVSSCAARYTDSLVPPAFCACDCSSPTCTGGVSCGACYPDGGVAVAPGQSHDLTWVAQTLTSFDRGGYTCVASTVLPAAVYSVAVPVFDDDTQATTGHDPRVVRQLFSLPAAGDVVTVDLSPVPGDGGATDGPTCDQAGPAPVCAAPFSPAAACSLDVSFTFGSDGGNTLERDQSSITPPNRYTRTRSYANSAKPPLTCSNDLPRCGASNDTFTTAEIAEALAAPDVLAALAEVAPPVYGDDTRPTDGPILAVRRSDGRGLFIGGPCATGDRLCARPLTAGIQHLAALLQKIDEQQLAAPGCEALRP